jgi:hypothetical protein
VVPALSVPRSFGADVEYYILRKKQKTGATDYQKLAHLLVNALDEVLEETRKER